MAEFKDILKELRLSNNLTQEELGEKVGLKKAAIYKYENGVNDNPSRDLISKLAKALNVSPSYLMGWNDDSETISEIESTELDGNLRAIQRIRNDISNEERESMDKMLEGIKELFEKQRERLDEESK